MAVVDSRAVDTSINKHDDNVGLTNNALRVLESRYLKREEGEIIDTPKQLFHRVADHVAKPERDRKLWADKFYKLMASKRFMPNSPTLMNAGRRLGALSACYVLPVPDDTKGIFKAISETAVIQKAGGGCVSGDAVVFVKGNGFVALKDLCSELPEPDEDGWTTLIRPINVASVDDSGRLCWAKATRIWRFEKSIGVGVHTQYGTLATSAEHPCFAVGRDGPEFKSAESLVGGADHLCRPCGYSDSFGLVSSAYLAGVIVGDGYLDSTSGDKLRLRIYSGCRSTLEFVSDLILDIYGTKYSVSVDNSRQTCWHLSAYNKSLIDDVSSYMPVGCKDDNGGFIPTDFSEAASYIAGLMDSDGYVEANKARASISTVSESLSRNIRLSLGVVGVPSTIRAREPGKRGTKVCYEVSFSVHDAPWLTRLVKRSFRADRIRDHLLNPDCRTISTPDWLRDVILDSGKFDTSSGDNRGRVVPGGADLQTIVYRTTQRTTRAKIDHVLKDAYDNDHTGLDFLTRCVDIKSVSPVSTSGLYDLSVSNTNRYLVVSDGLPCVVHNTGFAFDELRPCGSYVASSGGRASGPISFWRVFSEATSAIQQGSFRRGANMAMMRITHPDIFKFLFVKQDLKQFNNYNVSVKITDKWMGTFCNFPESPFTVEWEGRSWYVPREIVDRCKKAVTSGISGGAQPRELDVCYGVQDLLAVDEHASLPKDIVLVGEVMDIIVDHAWQTGEPGICFIDAIQKYEATPELGHIEATNPCSEQPLLPNESCNLGSLNLGKYVHAFYEKGSSIKDLDKLTDNARMQMVMWDELEQDVHAAIRFLDNVVTVNKYPTQEITNVCHTNRKIGLGVMGFADVLIKLGVQYDSELGLSWGDKLMSFINDAAKTASIELGKEKGEFPARTQSRWEDSMRNACVTSIAPTGSISIIADASGGIEPWFSFVFLRQVLNGKKLMEVQNDFKAIGELWGFSSKSLSDHIYEHGTLQDRDDVPEAAKRLFRTARDISPEYHIKMQAVFQKHVTSAVSKTINLPSDASKQSVSDAYMLAWEQGCKGVTVYRDGARANQPMALKSSGTAAPGTNGKVASFRSPASLNLPLPSIRFHYKSTHGSLHFHITLEPISGGRFREREVFFNLGRSGDGVHPITEVYGRLASMALRLDVHLETIIDQMRCHVARLEKLNGHTGGGTSLPSELAMGLLEYMKSVSDIRDQDGFLIEFPTFGAFATRKCSRAKPTAPMSSREFIKRVSQAAAAAGTFRTPCSTVGCPGEVIYSEGCHKCVICGEGGCS